MSVEKAILNNMHNMGMLNMNINDDGEFLSFNERMLADHLFYYDYYDDYSLSDYDNFYNKYCQKLIRYTSDVRIERLCLYWYFCINGGEIYDGYDEDDFVPMNEFASDLYIITPEFKTNLMVWEEAMIPFHLKTNEKHPKIVVDSWENIGKYAFVSNSCFIFDEWAYGLNCYNFEEIQDSFFTILDDGQFNSWVLTESNRLVCEVVDAFGGPSELW